MKAFVIGGAIAIFTLGFGSVVYAASKGAHVNIAHAIIVGSLLGSCWFVLHSIINIGRVNRHQHKELAATVEQLRQER